VPEDLRLLQSFLDSVDVESGQDDFSSLARFKAWLAAHDRPAAARTAAGTDLASATEIRDALRRLLATHHSGEAVDPKDRTTLQWYAGRIRLRVVFDEHGTPVLRPGGGGVEAVLGDVLIAAVTAAIDGRWARLRLCANDECAVVFYDQSRNGSRRWCDMGVCGNRMKLRAYRARHQRSGAS
jgi:predicted RNA-binding Zn ribbon-like protein